MGELLDECNQLCNIMGQSIVTTKESKKKDTAAASPAHRLTGFAAAFQFALCNSHFSLFNDL